MDGHSRPAPRSHQQRNGYGRSCLGASTQLAKYQDCPTHVPISQPCETARTSQITPGLSRNHFTTYTKRKAARARQTVVITTIAAIAMAYWTASREEHQHAL